MIVQKFGGKCLATIQDIQGVAARVAQQAKSGDRLVIVVSAMGQTTDELIRLAYQVSARPNRREMDMLLTTGERVSMALLSMALHDLGAPAISLTGSQAGVLTDDSHSQARIVQVQAPRVTEALAQSRIVVLAGFQGVSPTRKEVTTLGRGGSDTTAVAMAGYLKAARCEILKDVDGVCSTDPKLVKAAKRYSHLPFAAVRSMCFWGAKVLHLRAVELAEKMSIPLFVGSAQGHGIGTLIETRSNMFEKESVIGVNSHPRVMAVEIATASHADAFQRLRELVLQESLPFPLVLWSMTKDQATTLYLTSDNEGLDAVIRAGERNNVWSGLQVGLCSVTLNGFGLHTAGYLPRVMQLLLSHGIDPLQTFATSDGITLVLNSDHRQTAIESLHELVET